MKNEVKNEYYGYRFNILNSIENQYIQKIDELTLQLELKTKKVALLQLENQSLRLYVNIL